jgi:hypothetical protein
MSICFCQGIGSINVTTSLEHEGLIVDNSIE